MHPDRVKFMPGNFRRGFVNVKLLVVCMLIAGVGVWYFYFREGSKGIPTNIEDLKKENPFADKPGGNEITENVADPFGSPETPSVAPEDKSGTGKLVTVTPPTGKQIEPKTIIEPPPPKSTIAAREASLEGKWLAKWSVGSHNYTVEWDLKSGGAGFGKRTQNGNPVGQFQFKWYLADDTLVTEVGKSRAQFRYRAIDDRSFELTILSGVTLAPGQSRVMSFQQVK